MTPKLVITKHPLAAAPAKSGQSVALYLLQLRAEVHRRIGKQKPFANSPAHRGLPEFGPVSAKKIRG